MGTAPGSLIFVGDRKEDHPIIDAIAYNPESTKTYEHIEVADLKGIQSDGTVCWINLTGLHDPLVIENIGKVFDLHALMLEDILNTYQRPKYEEFDNCIYLVLKMLQYDTQNTSVGAEQVSIIIGNNWLFTFQEKEGDVFDPVRNRLIRPTTKIRHRNSDYLAFALIDTIVDQYVHITEQIGEKIELLEQSLLKAPAPEHLDEIDLYKREINYLRKTIRPVIEMVTQYKKSESELIDEKTLPYLSDLEDHVVQAAEAIEIYREMLNDQLDIYNAGLSNRLNDIIRVLTIFSVVFIPLTFLAGIYGTNFKYLPELEFQYAYPIFWGVLIVLALGMITYFKIKKWF
jgi:magnesium transporter